MEFHNRPHRAHRLNPYNLRLHRRLMDPIREAFHKAKQDIQDLKEQIALLTEETSFLRQALDDILYQQTDRQTDQHNIIQE